MHWNHRVIRHKNDKKLSDISEEYWYAIHEVHYDDQEEPVSCTSDPIQIIQEDLAAIKWEVDKIKEALEKPILDYEYFKN